MFGSGTRLWVVVAVSLAMVVWWVFSAALFGLHDAGGGRMRAARSGNTDGSEQVGKVSLLVTPHPGAAQVSDGVQRMSSPLREVREEVRLALDDSAGTATMSGTVLSCDTKMPLAGATVTLYAYKTSFDEQPIAVRFAKTDASGEFAWDNLATRKNYGGVLYSTRQYLLCVTHPDHAPSTAVAVPHQEGMSIYLGKPCTVRGVVVDSVTRLPIEGATVYARGSAARDCGSSSPAHFHSENLFPYPAVMCVSDAHGEFALGVTSQLDALVATKEGYAFERNDVWPSVERMHYEDGAEIRTSWTLYLRSGAGVISGMLVDDEDKPVGSNAGIAVRAYGLDNRIESSFERVVQATASGTFTMSGVPSGVSLSLQATGKQVEVTLEPGEHRTGVRVPVMRTCEVHGRLVSKTDGSPLAGEKLKVVMAHPDAPDTTVTDGDGRFVLHPRIWGSETGISTLSPGLLLYEGDAPTSTVSVKLSPGEKRVDIVVVGERSPYLRGKITRSIVPYDFGTLPIFALACHGVADAPLKCYNKMSTTDPEYWITFPAQWVGHTATVLAHQYHAVAICDVQLRAGENVVDLDMSNMVSVAGNLLLPDGSPLTDYWVWTDCMATDGKRLLGTTSSYQSVRTDGFSVRLPRWNRALICFKNLPDRPEVVAEIDTTNLPDKIKFDFVYNPVDGTVKAVRHEE